MAIVFQFTVVLVCMFVIASGGPTCLECNHAVSPSDCGTVKTCGDHERCFTDVFVISAGSIKYNTGCRDKTYCPTGGSGKRATGTKVLRDDVLICSECCTDTLCNSNLCRATGYPTIRGPLCYNCHQQGRADDCDQITMCGQDDVCMLHSTVNEVTHSFRYETKCQSEQQCLQAADTIRKYALIGRKRSSSSVEINGVCRIQCCGEDLCNNGNCSDTGMTATTNVLFTPTSHPAIVSAQSTGQCQVQLSDGSFETGLGWHIYLNGYERYQSHEALDGHRYISVQNGGAYQDIDFSQYAVTNFVLSGYSRAHSALAAGNDYSIYCDLTYTDGTVGFGKSAQFDPTRTSWNKQTLVVHSTKTIALARCYAMFRNGSGSADFDNFRLESCS